ncbi:hypothetical protein EV200_11188 [Pedobacter psychrotolerans]|uniref:Uncharacterized protein n=1 Tax=Pedobacter psychrotolerans TaxID=1843235 RepID=A0A4R2H532_9SPHI|nr:hypothetical protein EV200_11188 [Pedobacter psychrotolerans]GGE70454.1 hypothetical protein GCM10011413_41450 [Pedobacter psychrotolerans]
MELATDRTNIPEMVKQMIDTDLKIVYKYPEQTVSFQRKFVDAIYPQKLYLITALIEHLKPIL